MVSEIGIAHTCSCMLVGLVRSVWLEILDEGSGPDFILGHNDLAPFLGLTSVNGIQRWTVEYVISRVKKRTAWKPAGRHEMNHTAIEGAGV
jgi:hypothetical protein